jgi:hypothetical protein
MQTADSLVSNFDQMPDDAILNDHAAAIILGVSVWTLRRTAPVPKRQISERRYGRRVGDIRAKVRGNWNPGQRPAA